MNYNIICKLSKRMKLNKEKYYYPRYMFSVSFSSIYLVNTNFGYSTCVSSHQAFLFLEILHDSYFIPKIIEGS